MATYSDTYTWTNWVSYEYSTSATSTWQLWNTYDDTSSSTTVSCDYDTVWNDWVYMTVDNGQVISIGRADYTPKPASLSELNQVTIQIEWAKYLRQLEHEEREQREKKADMTATELLLELIGEDQREVYERTKRLLVKGKKYDYLLSKGLFGCRVQRVEKDKIVDLCIHISSPVRIPGSDHVLAMKLAIDDDEDGFNKKANRTGSSFLRDPMPEAAVA